MSNPVIHWEFWSQNPERCSDFYEKAFDWKIQHLPEIRYRLVDTGGQGINGGILNPQWPGNMTMYIEVEDLETYSEKITAAGGKIIVPKTEIPGAGSFVLFQDPEGRVLGLWLKEP